MNAMDWPDLMRSTRWAALGTVDAAGAPLVSAVAFAPAEGALLVHVSQLAAHTRNLRERPRFSLLLSEPDSGEATDPQTLARLTLSGGAAVVDRESGEDFAAAARAYLARFPEAEPRFGFGDFHLIRLTPESGNFVGGFGRAARLDGAKIAAALENF
ncbi:MAG: pyridoxamine 5'-phosphate oxidase family protein [Akkermansiaceae bacterium]|nr:pyridoxamine 5'-phosphate oxidase family protein [Akkermansiaceae bacterium]